MSAVNAFNDMMGQFLMELYKTFPEEKGLKKTITVFEVVRETNPKKSVDKFMNSIAPYVDKINSRDESLFLEDANNLEFMNSVNIKNCWPKASDGTKDAIWQYIQTLYMLGTTIKSVPAETLSMIENVAKQCVDNMKNEDGGLDEAQLMKTMQGMFGGMTKK